MNNQNSLTGLNTSLSNSNFATCVSNNITGQPGPNDELRYHGTELVMLYDYKVRIVLLLNTSIKILLLNTSSVETLLVQ
jgi:hypothetical protein